MMTLEDYALDVGKSVEEIEALCDKVGIVYQDENSLLDDVSITLLDNELQEEEVSGTGGSDDLEEKRLEEEVEDKAEELAISTRIDLETTSFTKVKSKNSQKQENNKKEFLKERKKIWKSKIKTSKKDRNK